MMFMHANKNNLKRARDNKNSTTDKVSTFSGMMPAKVGSIMHVCMQNQYFSLKQMRTCPTMHNLTLKRAA